MIIFGVGRKSFKYSLALEGRGKSGRDLKKKNARQVVKKAEPQNETLFFFQRLAP